MVTSEARTPEDYLMQLPEDRRRIVAAVRDVVNANLPPGFREGMVYGMIGWAVPLESHGTATRQPLGLAGIASQKQYVSLYLNHVYADPTLERWFRERWAASGKRLNMGKSCVRFTRLEDVPLDVIGEVIARADVGSMIERHEANRASSRQARATG